MRESCKVLVALPFVRTRNGSEREEQREPLGAGMAAAKPRGFRGEESCVFWLLRRRAGAAETSLHREKRRQRLAVTSTR